MLFRDLHTQRGGKVQHILVAEITFCAKPQEINGTSESWMSEEGNPSFTTKMKLQRE